MKTTIHFTLIFCLALQPAIAAESGVGTAATGALQGVANTLGHANNLMGSIQGSQTQMQALVNQLNGQTQNLGNMSPFDQIKMQLAAAMGEAQTCVQKHTKDYSKYKKAPSDPAELSAKLDATPTCTNYGAIIDSAKKVNDQMKDTNSKMACITNMQNKINEIAESAKKPFNDLTQAAGAVWNTRQQIIDTHKDIADTVDKDLNSKGGFKDQLNNLKKLNGQISNALKAGGGKDGSAGGFDVQIKKLKFARVDAANDWYRTLTLEVQRCFASDSSRECSLGTAASPADCVRAYVGNSGKGTPAEKAQAKANAGRLQNTFILNTGDIKLVDTRSNIDISNPTQLLAHADKRFNQMVSKVVANFKNQQFVGSNVDKNALANFVRTKYQECYDSAAAKDMTTASAPYQSTLAALQDQEASINNEITNLVKDATDAMNGFRTSFNKIYNRDLSQFASDCTASGSVYESVDCLRKISVTLESGIKGTRSSIKLEDGSTATFTPGATVMNLQTMSLDQAGQPTVTTTATQCVGFDECINVMDRYQAHHTGQVKVQEKQREAFVTNHNKTMDTTLVGVSAQFAEISKMITAGVQGINEDLAKLGVAASLTTKQVEGEPLVKNEKTGLYDMPKSMKAAMAGVGNYSELDNPGAVTESYNARITELNDKLKEAAKAKAACAIKQGDLDDILNRIGRCDRNICSGDRVARILRPLEFLVRKSQVMPGDSSDKDSITKDYESCSRTAKADARDAVRSDFEAETSIESIEDATRRDKRREAYEKAKALNKSFAVEDARSCPQLAVGDLEALTANSRETMSGTNKKIIAAIRGISDACSTDPLDDTAIDAAIEACEDARRTVSGASPPSDEAETDVSSTSSSGGFTNPLKDSGSGVKGAQ